MNESKERSLAQFTQFSVDVTVPRLIYSFPHCWFLRRTQYAFINCFKTSFQCIWKVFTALHFLRIPNSVFIECELSSVICLVICFYNLTITFPALLCLGSAWWGVRTRSCPWCWSAGLSSNRGRDYTPGHAPYSQPGNFCCHGYW